MKKPTKLEKIIHEELQKIEVDKHAVDQVRARLDRMAKDGDITKKEEVEIRRNLENVMNYNFDDKDYAIFLGSFAPNPNSPLYTDTNKYDPGIPFYQIYSNDGVFAKDSTGDEMWAIVRDGTLKTVMLRKSVQRRSANKARNDDGGLGVDMPIFNFDEFMQKRKQERLQRQQAVARKEEELKKLKQINGVWWKVDDEKEVVHQKNKPNNFVKFDDIITYPNWDDETKEDLIGRMN